MSTLTPQQIAERARDAMWAQDASGKALGITITAIAPGRATATMRVRVDMGGFVLLTGRSVDYREAFRSRQAIVAGISLML